MNESENENLQWVAATDVDDYDDGASSGCLVNTAVAWI